jgi:hypothetical protein
MSRQLRFTFRNCIHYSVEPRHLISRHLTEDTSAISCTARPASTPAAATTMDLMFQTIMMQQHADSMQRGILPLWVRQQPGPSWAYCSTSGRASDQMQRHNGLQQGRGLRQPTPVQHPPSHCQQQQGPAAAATFHPLQPPGWGQDGAMAQSEGCPVFVALDISLTLTAFTLEPPYMNSCSPVWARAQRVAVRQGACGGPGL